MKQESTKQEVVSECIHIENISVSVQGKPILTNLSLDIKPGEVHAIMGPNGSGKSTLSFVLAGHPRYALEHGKIVFKGKDCTKLSPAERAKLGIFLAFQYPVEIPGVTLRHFLYTIYKQQNPETTPIQFKHVLQAQLNALGFDPAFLDRQVNVGFSGGEKKRAEVLQLLLLKPSFAVLDETDSGLDVDSLKIVAQTVNSLRGKEFSALVITHYPHLLEFMKPEVVHILAQGNIVATGDLSLAREVEQNGYKKWVKMGEEQ